MLISMKYLHVWYLYKQNIKWVYSVYWLWSGRSEESSRYSHVRQVPVNTWNIRDRFIVHWYQASSSLAPKTMLLHDWSPHLKNKFSCLTRLALIYKFSYIPIWLFEKKEESCLVPILVFLYARSPKQKDTPSSPTCLLPTTWWHPSMHCNLHRMLLHLR